MIERVERLIGIMLDVATDRATIRQKQREYVHLWKEIDGDLRRVPGPELHHPNEFADLYEWRAYYEEHLPSHEARYGFLRDLYRPLIRGLEVAPTPEMAGGRREQAPERWGSLIEFVERTQGPIDVVGAEVLAGLQRRRSRERLRNFFYDEWVIGIGSAVLAAGVIAVIIAIFTMLL